MPNHLIHQTSPYLLQHADNPVEWHPWGEQALALAKQQDKPILLSIGYSACHWCHVMAHESFEDPQVAQVMNEHFINIKVDREERPDIDQIYQTAHYMLTQRSGGWPLTLFLTPDQKPFFGGTYFPKTPRYNLPGFPDLITRVAQYYYANKEEIEKQSEALQQAFGRMLPEASDNTKLSAKPLDRALRHLKNAFDPVYGGFGGAPKFPHATDLELCLRQYAVGGDQSALNIAAFTLKKMANGGIYDQLGGGFSRYSVDEQWAIPHFEKMLYDNGPLLQLYTQAFSATKDEQFRTVAVETASWVLREMQSPEGGYYSTLDADSEHEEGKFYVWDRDQVADILSPEEYRIVEHYYGFDRAPNFEGKHWHLVITADIKEIAEALDIAPNVAKEQLASARAKLFLEREKRIRPGRDEKILVSWNGLMIKGMAHAGRILQNDEWIDSARRAVDFIRKTLWNGERLLATYKDDKAHLNAYLDDYAFLLDGLLELLQARFRVEDLVFAQQLAEVLLARFEDIEHGGFFFTSHDHEQLIHRLKSGHDNATPSGNSVAAYALQRLGHLIGETGYLSATERTLRLFYPAMEQSPAGFTTLLFALSEWLTPPRIVILRGSTTLMTQWQTSLQEFYAPYTLILSIPPAMADLPQVLNKKFDGADSSIAAWVCQGSSCLPPIHSLTELKAICKNKEPV